MTIKCQLISAGLFIFAIILGMEACVASGKITTALLINNSDADWKIIINLAKGSLGETSECQNKAECLIPKHDAKTIFYQSPDRGDFAGTIKIIDTQGKGKPYVITSYSIWYPNLPYILPTEEGNTLPVALNSPHEGGIVISGSSWNWTGNL